MAAPLTNGSAPADVEMADPAPSQPHLQSLVPPDSPAPPLAAPTTAPPAQAQAQATTPSRQAPTPTASTAPPDRPAAHGSSTRLYLNANVTPHLLEGMKQLAAAEPEKPLKWLSEFLARRSGEVEA